MSGQERKPPYSIRDVPRLHSKNLAGKRPEVHWAGARVMVDAVEAEFARQAKPKLGDASDAKDKSPPGGGAEEKDKPGSSRDRAPPNDSAEPDTETPVYAKEAERIRALYRQLNVSLNPPNYPMTDVADLDTETPDNWVPRLSPNIDSSLVRNTGAHPLNAEPRLSDLESDGLLTSTLHHYVRNHGSVPFLEWETHSIRLDGIGRSGAVEVSMDEIAGMENIEIPVTMACDGMRRAELNRVKRSQGFDWSAGAISTALWTGTPLSSFLRKYFPNLPADPSGLYVHFEGSDNLQHGSYGTSLSLVFCLDEKNDAMLAYKMNGVVLPPDHGYPVRTILPGMVGGRTVKWLRSIRISDSESTNWYHLHDNRMFPSAVETENDLDDGWRGHPDTIIMQLPIESVITSPAPGFSLPLSSVTPDARYTIRGYASAGSGHRISRVELCLRSPNSPEKWRYCTRSFLPGAGRWGGERHWTWCWWELEVSLVELVDAEEIAVRAQDERHDSQPEHSVWNLKGFLGNGIYRVRKRIEAIDDNETGEKKEAVVSFSHPTDTGEPKNGWMVAKEEEKVAGPELGDLKEVDWDEVGKHNKREDMWIVIDGVVYDVTDFASHHPGGPAPLLANAGRDASTVFASIHDARARNMATTFAVARVSSGSPVPKPTRSAEHPVGKSHAIHPTRWIAVSLVAKEIITHDTRRFTFKVPEGKGKLGLPVGRHVRIGIHMRDRMVQRPYTPVRPIFEGEDDGTFDLVIKVYFPNTDPRYPPGGLVSNYLDTMEIGDRIDVKGPEGFIEYDGHGKFNIAGEDLEVKKVALVAGGTGITPIYQIIHRILLDPSDKTHLRLVFANKTVDDILLRSELDALAVKYPDRFQLLYSVDKEPEKEDKKRGIGHFGHTDLNTLKFLFEPNPKASAKLSARKEEAIALVCGPPAMMEKAVYPAMKQIGYNLDQNLWAF